MADRGFPRPEGLGGYDWLPHADHHSKFLHIFNKNKENFKNEGRLNGCGKIKKTNLTFASGYSLQTFLRVQWPPCSVSALPGR